MQNNKAFTLAEVLITLGIIGIVAAMTLPSLIQKQQEKIMINRLKKVYSELQQTYQSLYAEYGSPANWGIGDNNMRFVNLFASKMKFTKICEPMHEGCWYSGTIRKLDGRNDINLLTYNFYSTAILNDGTTFAFYEDIEEGCEDFNRKDLLCSQIVVDLNGNQKPNRFGYDIFTFLLQNNRLIPRGWPMAEESELETAATFRTHCYTHGHACTGWVLINENMDYKYCNDLSWDGKTKCK